MEITRRLFRIGRVRAGSSSGRISRQMAASNKATIGDFISKEEEKEDKLVSLVKGRRRRRPRRRRRRIRRRRRLRRLAIGSC